MTISNVKNTVKLYVDNFYIANLRTLSTSDYNIILTFMLIIYNLKIIILKTIL
jgi:hypothetical protein